MQLLKVARTDWWKRLPLYRVAREACDDTERCREIYRGTVCLTDLSEVGCVSKKVLSHGVEITLSFSGPYPPLTHGMLHRFAVLPCFACAANRKQVVSAFGY